MAIKNYTSDKPIDRIFAELQQTLGTHGAKQISFDYGDDGKVHGLQFVIKVNDRFLPIKLPARVENGVLAVLEQKTTICCKYLSLQYFCISWRDCIKWYSVEWSTPVILAIDAFDTCRPNKV